MTQPREADRLITAFLAEGPVELADRSYEAVRDSIERTRQRSVIETWRFPVPSSSARLVLVASAFLMAFVAGIDLLGTRDTGSQGRPIASPSPSVSPSPSPSASPSLSASSSPLALPDGGDIQAGTYQLAAGFPVLLTVDVPNQWAACSSSVVEQAVCPVTDTPALSNASLSFLIIENVVAEPCVDEGLVPQVGPTVDDLASAIAGLDGFEATAPVAIAVDGHPGKELVVVAPDSASCDSLFTWMTANRTNGVGLREINRLRIVDVDGVRVLIAAAWFPLDQSRDQPPELKAVFESVRFPRG
jgi:hypothetical protein